METALLAALTGLFGIALGRMWDFRLEVIRWRRDQRVRVYEDLAANYYAAREPMLTMAMTKPGTPEADAAVTRALSVVAEWNSRMVATWLHGSPIVTAALQEFDRELTLLFDKARTCCLTYEEFAYEHRATEHGLEVLIDAIRQELKNPRLNIKLRI
jgi:hypothetical protein